MTMWPSRHDIAPKGRPRVHGIFANQCMANASYNRREGRDLCSNSNQNACDPRRPLNFQNKPIKPAMIRATTSPSQLFASVDTSG